MTFDIYTRLPIVQDSSEHVVPSFLGGRLQRCGILDQTTNSAFGRGIEADLAKALQPFRVPVGGISDANKFAPVLIVPGADGAEYRIGPGGAVNRVPTPPKFEEHEGGLHVDAAFTGATPEAAMNALRTAVSVRAQRTGFDADTSRRLVAQATTLARTSTSEPPHLTFSTDLCTVPCYRATAKIACNLLACHDRELFLRRELDPIRALVLHGTPVDPWPVQAVAVDVHARGLGPLDHFVTVQSAEGGITALVVYFGSLAFLVRLGTLVLPTFSISYRVNQIRTHSAIRDRRDDPADTAISLPSFRQAAVQTDEEFLGVVQHAIGVAAAGVIRVQKELHDRRQAMRPTKRGSL